MYTIIEAFLSMIDWTWIYAKLSFISIQYDEFIHISIVDDIESIVEI